MRTIFYLIALSFLLACGEIGKAKSEWIKEFDLDLEGEVISTTYNEYGQLLVCLNVTRSNYEFYCPIYDPNKYLESNTWEKRFFINVTGNKAIFICNPKDEFSKVYNELNQGSTVTINEDSSRTFRVYNKSKTVKYGGLSIMTYPIRENLTHSCGG